MKSVYIEQIVVQISNGHTQTNKTHNIIMHAGEKNQSKKRCTTPAVSKENKKRSSYLWHLKAKFLVAGLGAFGLAAVVVLQ